MHPGGHALPPEGMARATRPYVAGLETLLATRQRRPVRIANSNSSVFVAVPARLIQAALPLLRTQLSTIISQLLSATAPISCTNFRHRATKKSSFPQAHF
jgi:hypothetical protein